MLLAILAYVIWRYPHVHHFHYIIYLAVVLYVESFPSITHSTQNWSPLTRPSVQQMPEPKEAELVSTIFVSATHELVAAFESTPFESTRFESTRFEWRDTDSEALEEVSSILYNDARVVYQYKGVVFCAYFTS